MKSPMDFHRHFHRVDFATFAIFALCEFLSLFMGLVIGGVGCARGGLGGGRQPPGTREEDGRIEIWLILPVAYACLKD